MINSSKITLDLLKGIIGGSLNPMTCVKIVNYDDEKAIRFVLFNEAFEALYGDAAKALSESVIKLSEMAQMNQNDALSVTILEVYETGNAVYKLIEMPDLKKTFKIKGFIPYEGYICVVLADVTEFEDAKKEAQEMASLASSASEQLKYQVDLLTATKKQIESTTRIHEMVAQSCSDGFYYKDFVNGVFFASDSWYNLFTYDGVRPFDSKNIVNAISDSDVFDFSRWREKTIMDNAPSMVCEFKLCDNVTWIEATYRFFYDENKKLVEEIGFFKDITTIKLQK